MCILISSTEPIKNIFIDKICEEPKNESIDYSILISLKQYFQGDEDSNVFIDIINTYLNETQERLGELEQAIKIDDSNKIMLIAHGLKGISSTLGMVKFSSICFSLEKLAFDGILTTNYTTLTQLQQEFTHIGSGLKDLIKENNSH